MTVVINACKLFYTVLPQFQDRYLTARKTWLRFYTEIVVYTSIFFNSLPDTPLQTKTRHFRSISALIDVGKLVFSTHLSHMLARETLKKEDKSVKLSFAM